MILIHILLYSLLTQMQTCTGCRYVRLFCNFNSDACMNNSILGCSIHSQLFVILLKWITRALGTYHGTIRYATGVPPVRPLFFARMTECCCRGSESFPVCARDMVYCKFHEHLKCARTIHVYSVNGLGKTLT